MKQIIVEVDTDGTIKIDAVGFTGNACEKATQAIQQALSSAPPKGGGRKPEYQQKTVQGQAQG